MLWSIRGRYPPVVAKSFRWPDVRSQPNTTVSLPPRLRKSDVRRNMSRSWRRLTSLCLRLAHQPAPAQPVAQPAAAPTPVPTVTKLNWGAGNTNNELGHVSLTSVFHLIWWSMSNRFSTIWDDFALDSNFLRRWFWNSCGETCEPSLEACPVLYQSKSLKSDVLGHQISMIFVFPSVCPIFLHPLGHGCWPPGYSVLASGLALWLCLGRFLDSRGDGCCGGSGTGFPTCFTTSIKSSCRTIWRSWT